MFREGMEEPRNEHFPHKSGTQQEYWEGVLGRSNGAREAHGSGIFGEQGSNAVHQLTPTPPWEWSTHRELDLHRPEASNLIHIPHVKSHYLQGKKSVLNLKLRIRIWGAWATQ